MVTGFSLKGQVGSNELELAEDSFHVRELTRAGAISRNGKVRRLCFK